MAGEQSDFQDKLFITPNIYVHLNKFWHEESSLLNGSCA